MSEDAAKAALEAYSRNADTGRFSFTWTNLHPAVSSRGQQHTLSCHRYKDAKCKFQLVLEHTTEGVIIQRASLEHSHPLPTSLAEANSHAALRLIPRPLVELAQTCAGAGLIPSKVNDMLQERARELQLQVTWNYHDVYRLVSATAAEKTLDAMGMLELLMERSKLLGLPFSIKSGDDGRLERAFFVLEGGQSLYAQQVAHMKTFTLFDTSVRCTLLICSFPSLVANDCVVASFTPSPLFSCSSRRTATA